ncbi:MAG: OB-fold nucleic acid binding domain-containing protein [Candidatus Nanohaloarchaeota archaeon QJJ-7]|nr:OB-fold nucleic acid binding domain-containing protein [Candidatus Nanohaloarchaeota archaeon QJJ-7]
MVDELVEKISEETGEPEEEIKERIGSKVEELSGLVSEEGAAHLVAREEGIELAEAGDKELTVENIVPGMNRVDLKCKVVDISDINTFERDEGEEGQVRNVVLGDRTGTVRLTLWNDQTEVGDKIEEGDSIHIKNAYSREDNRGNVELRVGDETKIGMMEEEIDEVADTGNSSGGGHRKARTNQVMNENVNYEVEGTLVEIYADEPFYKACPECQKKVEKEDGSWRCEEHGEVEASDNMIISAIIDDGYGNLRTVFFREQAQELLGLDEDPEGNLETVQSGAEDVKGEEIVVKGRSRYNDFFNRTELIGNEIEYKSDDEMLEEKLAVVR